MPSERRLRKAPTSLPSAAVDAMRRLAALGLALGLGGGACAQDAAVRSVLAPVRGCAFPNVCGARALRLGLSAVPRAAPLTLLTAARPPSRRLAVGGTCAFRWTC